VHSPGSNATGCYCAALLAVKPMLERSRIIGRWGDWHVRFRAYTHSPMAQRANVQKL
jgi:hypothetical protein